MKPNSRLKYERELRGWSQKRVADEIGTDERSVGRWERGERQPSPHYREKLCELFGKSAQELGFVEDASDILLSDWQHIQHIKENLLPAVLHDPMMPPLPNEGRELVGRQELLDTLTTQLSRRKCVVLSGLPGVGKTAIAVTLLQHPNVCETFSDGVLWAGPGPHPNVLEQLSRWSALLGLPVEAGMESSVEARVAALRAAIGMRRIVLVVDDVWEIETALHFKVGGPNCAFLVTTRIPSVAVGITNDGVYTVPELNLDYGRALLAQLAPKAVFHDMQAAQNLVQEVGGLPLALILLGKYLRKQSQGDQHRRLKAALTRLQDGSQRLLISGHFAPFERPPNLPIGTPLSLQSAIAISDTQLLDEQARAVFYALSVFPARPNSFSEEAALMVAQTSAEVLDTVYDTGLLESSGPERYSLHQVIADYSSTHLTETLARERLVAYCIPFIESHYTDYEALELESRNLLAALKYAFESGLYAQLVRGINAFAPFLLVRGLYDLALLHLQRAYQVSIWSGDTLALTLVLLNLGRTKYQQGEHNQAIVYLREGLSEAQKGIYHEQACQLLALLGTVALQQEDLAQAETYWLQGLLFARELANNQSTCELLVNLACIAGVRGEEQQAEVFLQEALVLAEESGVPLMMSRVLCTWGELKLRQRQFDAAQAHFLQAFEKIQQEDEPEQLAIVQAGLARVALVRGSIEETDE